MQIKEWEKSEKIIGQCLNIYEDDVEQDLCPLVSKDADDLKLAQVQIDKLSQLFKEATVKHKKKFKELNFEIKQYKKIVETADKKS